MCLILSGMLHSSSAIAGEIEYRFIPYIWTAGIDGDIGPPRRTSSVDVSFSDYLEFIDIGSAFAFEVIGEKPEVGKKNEDALVVDHRAR